MINTWITALKIFNKGKKKYVVPKKDTKEYKEVKDIQEKLKNDKKISDGK